MDQPREGVNGTSSSISIYQSNTYRKELSWLLFDDEARIQERQQVKDKHTQFGVISSLLMKSSFQIFKDKIRFLSDVEVNF